MSVQELDLSHANQDCPMEEPDFDVCLVMSDLNASNEEAHVIDACERPTAAVAANPAQGFEV